MVLASPPVSAMRFAFCLVAVLSAAFVASRVAEAADPVTAEALFREGRRDVEAGNFVAACAKFEESNRLDPAAGTLLNLADCEETRGQLARAWQHFKELYDELPPSDERRVIAESRARILERRTPKLRVVLSAPYSATVKRDETLLGPASLGARLPVDPGRHVVLVSAVGRWDRRYEVDVAEGQDKEVVVSPGDLLEPGGESPALTPIPPAMPPDARTELALPPAVDSGGNPRRTTAYVLGGVGGAALLTGGAFGIAALSQLSASNASCTGNVCSNEGAIHQFQSAQSFALVADITMGVGVVCIATAVVLGLTGSHGAHDAGQASLPRWLQGRF
jgi:hypothetical protein